MFDRYHGHCIHLDMEHMNVHELWKRRLELLQELISAGVDCIFSDADAFWLDNMASHVLRQATEHDASIVASRGSFPTTEGKKWGATLCMGFIYFKSCPATVLLTERMVELYEQTKDDQKSINKALDETNIKWRTRLTYIESTVIEYGDTSFKNHPLTVAMLPHNQVMRRCPTDPYVIPNSVGVAHCLTHKNGASKKEAASEYNLWVIKDEQQVEDAKKNEDIKTWNEFVHAIADTTVLDSL